MLAITLPAAAKANLMGNPVPEGQRANFPGRSVVSLLACDCALAIAIAVLALGFVLPQLCTSIQIILIAVFIFHGSAAWLPAMVILLCTPTDWKAGGMDLQYEKFEGVVVYVLGFPMTASYAIVAASFVRGLLEWATMPQLFARQLNRLWLVPITIGASVCVYSAILALLDRTPSWSSAARPTLVLVSLWYAISLARDWPLVRDVMMRRMGPLCVAIVASGFFAPLAGTFTCFYLSFASAWATLIAFGNAGRNKPGLRELGLLACVICLAVPIGGIRISSEVSQATMAKLGGSRLSLNIAGAVIIAAVLALTHAWLLLRKPSLLPFFVASTAFAAYAAIPFVVAGFSSNREFDVTDRGTNVTSQFTFKFLVERPAIWRGAIESLAEPPYVIVPPRREGSVITAGGKRAKWGYGSHNLILEILRSQGFLAGGISLAILFACFLACVRCYMTVNEAAATVAAITFIVGGVINGISVGHLLESGTGFMLYICAGIAMGALGHQDYLAARCRSRQASPEPPDSRPGSGLESPPAPGLRAIEDSSGILVAG